MNDDLIYEELREAITKDLNDLKLIFPDNGIANDTYNKLFKEGGEWAADHTQEAVFFKNHLIDRTKKNIKNLQNYLEKTE
jgi:hypothetical protein